MSGNPIHRPFSHNLLSQDVIALQTADMLVGWARACNLADMNKRAAPILPGQNRQIKSLFLPIGEEQLNSFAEETRLKDVMAGISHSSKEVR
jgi:hypothetical protein